MNHAPGAARARWLHAVLACAALAPTQAAVAWGDDGHAVIATIAYAHLTPAARKQVDALLAADTDKLTAPDFASRATWADKYRDSDRMTTKQRYNATHKWHFVDIEIDGGSVDDACKPRTPLPAKTPASKGPPQACVVDKIEQFRVELKSPATPRAEKILALKFLLHFVGDVHQPLHSADHHDGGGNGVPVLYGGLNVPDNLHSYWDRHVVQKLGRKPWVVGADLNKAISAEQLASWSTGGAEQWAEESAAQAKRVAYDFSGATAFTDAKGHAGEKFDASYEARALLVAREQLSKAGVRLAALLNDALK